MMKVKNKLRLKQNLKLQIIYKIKKKKKNNLKM